MNKLLAIFGATGSQGSSVIKTALSDPVLRDSFRIRALTRNSTGQTAKDLQGQGVEIVEFDPENEQSLRAAVKNAHTVFLMTATDYHAAKEDEVTFARKVADIAVEEKVDHFIFSTLPSPAAVSGGKYTGVDGFDAKAEIERYIRSTPLKASFYAPGTFMNNFVGGMKPRRGDDGTYSIYGVVASTTQFPLIDTAGDTGKYVAPLLLDPNVYHGKVLACASQLLTMDQITQVYSKVTGKTINYRQLPIEVYSRFLPNPRMAVNLTEMMLYFQDFEYFGADTKSKIEQGQSVARGTLTNFEEFLRGEKLDLEASA